MKNRSMVPEKIINYCHLETIARFGSVTGLSLSESKTVFRELIKFLWLRNKLIQDSDKRKKGLPKKIYMRDEMIFMDEMWHIFLQYMEDYEQFCQRSFGRVLLHRPTPENEKAWRVQASIRIQMEEEYEKYFKYIYENLGSRTAKKWFSFLSRPYSDVAFRNSWQNFMKTAKGGPSCRTKKSAA